MRECIIKWGNMVKSGGTGAVGVKKGRELTEIILKERPTVSIEQLVQLLIKLKYDLIEEDCARREILMTIQELLEKLLLEGKL
ncbi:MAG: hypothetical protein A2Y60_01480 [Chloroflexi bacterium RBG_13_54_9]|nr:MAG: hypothetical protein A2Y60_01480 [Chloroflexi bacterium RBG_13_54_9]